MSDVSINISSKHHPYLKQRVCKTCDLLHDNVYLIVHMELQMAESL